MEENSADFFLNLVFGPIRMMHAEARRFEFSRRSVQVEGGFEFLLRRHAAQNLEMFRAVVFVRHNVNLLWPGNFCETKKALPRERLCVLNFAVS
jgi:hypothetical protein